MSFRLSSSVRALSLAILSGVFGLGCAVEIDPTADAAQIDEAEEAAVGVNQEAVTLAPSCIKLIQWKTNWGVDSAAFATAENHCASTKRVRLIWRWALDTPCVSLSRGESYTAYRSTIGGPDPYITEVRSC